MQIKVFIYVFLLPFYFLICHSISGQSHNTRNNYTGSYENPSSWDPLWASPSSNIRNTFTINGQITSNGSLNVNGSSGKLVVNDTLIIYGDLYLGEENKLLINNNAILIVFGNLHLDEESEVDANGYFIVTQNILGPGDDDDGKFKSNDNPAKVFIGGSVPSYLTNDNSRFPALNCHSPAHPYAHSRCSSGDMIDLANDPIYPFFQSTCIAKPTITVIGPTSFCSGGSVTLTSSAGTTYLWSTGATTASIIVTVSGNYTVKVTNSRGCQSVASAATIVTVNALPATPTITVGGPTAFCVGGSVTLTSSAGVSYLWSTGATTASINVTTAGSYSVKVKNANGCQSSSSVATVVTVNALPATPTITAGGTITFCTGGSVTLTSSAGSTYLWSTGATTASINATTSGNYTVQITNANGCQSTASIATVVTVNSLPSTPTITAGGPTTFCAGGSITLTSSAGTSYLWSNGAATASINVTTSGSYTVRITNANGCQSAASAASIVTVNALPATPTITAGGPTTFCAGGSVLLTSSAGISYLWSNGATTASINVTSSGSYTVRVTNANGCQSTVSSATVVTVNALPVTPTITAGGPTTFCAGGNVTLTSSAASTYLWSTGATTASINVTAAGSYTVMVTNANGCQSAISAARVVIVNARPVVNAGTNATIPNGTSTTLNATVSGTGPFIYSWTPASQLVNASVEDPTTVNLPSTTVFTLTATSTTSCSNSGNVTITISGGPLTSTPTAAPGTVCVGEIVQLNAVASGGNAGSYIYTWTSLPAGFTSSIATPVATPNVNTTYYVAVFDGFNTVNSSVSVTVNAIPTTPIITPGGPTTFCRGGNVTLTSSASSTYLWSTGATTQSINVTAQGSYTVQVTNASGCQSASSSATMVSVNSLPATPTITAGGTTTFCAGSNVTLTSSGGTSYLWSNLSTTASINASTAGSYTVRVTNASGCQSASSSPIVVTINALPATPTIAAGGPTTFCTGGNVRLTSSAGTGYLWSNAATSSDLTVSTPGSFTVQVINANGCLSSASLATVVTVNPLPATPTITAGGPVTFCTGGSVTLTSSAGTSYLWSSGATTQSTNISLSGSYSVTVTNGSGCTSAPSEATEVVVNPIPFTPTITAIGPTTFCVGDKVILASSAGTNYLWSTGETTSSINVGSSGSYTVKLINPSGCESAVSVPDIVTVNSLPSTPIITPSGPLVFCEGGTVTLTSSEGTTYLWSTGETSPGINVITKGSYTVKLTNSSGCVSAVSEAAIVNVNALPLVTITSNSAMCVDDLLTLTGSPAGGTFTLIDGPGTISGNVLSATDTGSFYIEYLYSNVCAGTAMQYIVVGDKPVAVAGSDQVLKYVFETNLEAILSGSGTGEWSVISGSGKILDIHSPTSRATALSIGDNTFLWTVNNGICAASAEVTITVIDLFVPSVITPNGDGKNDCFKVTDIGCRVELIIFNRWGNVEYNNNNYLNDWDGRNRKGMELPDETYFYILKFGNGIVRKGTVLITR